MSRAERKARTRVAILSAARGLFERRGFDGTSIRDVASAAGVGVGTVHAHFVDKKVLLLECFQEQLANAVALGFDSLEPEWGLVEKLRHLGQVLYAAYARHPELSRVMFTASLFPDEPTPDPLFADFLNEVAALFREARDRGEIQRLPADGIHAAQGFFAAYMAILIGGLAGHFGPAEEEGAAERWARALGGMLRLQFVGLGADPSLLEEEP